MKNLLMAAVVVFIVCCSGNSAFAQQAAVKHPGEAKFIELCALCHPEGGNIVNPKKTLFKKDREANNIKTEADIIRNMRNPGPGMTRFDEKTVPDKEAREIATYILKTFK